MSPLFLGRKWSCFYCMPSWGTRNFAKSHTKIIRLKGKTGVGAGHSELRQVCDQITNCLKHQKNKYCLRGHLRDSPGGNSEWWQAVGEDSKNIWKHISPCSVFRTQQALCEGHKSRFRSPALSLQTYRTAPVSAGFSSPATALCRSWALNLLSFVH